MVRRCDLCGPTDFGGLGFVETHARNISLLAKWILKLERGRSRFELSNLAKQVSRRRVFFESNAMGGSQF